MSLHIMYIMLQGRPKTDIVKLPCFNPECDSTVKMTIEQKGTMLINFALKYDISCLPCCCQDCAEAVVKLLGGPKYKDLAKKAQDARQKMRDAR